MNVAAPAILTPSIRSSAPIFRRAAHWVHTVTEPAASTPASKSASGAACGSEKSSARPGRPNQADSPTVLDLSEGSVALDLIGLARASGVDPLVWVLPEDLPRLDLGTGLAKDALADLLSQVASVTDEQGSARDLSLEAAMLERVIDILGGQATVASVVAGLRALAQVGDPRDDAAAGLITSGQADRLTAMFGRGATDRVVLERAWILEAQLRKLAAVGTALVPLPRSALRVVALGQRVGAVGSKVLGTYLTVALTHLLRETQPGHPGSTRCSCSARTSCAAIRSTG